MSARRFALVAGGGTGGHLVPALAVCRALAAGRDADAVELVGSRRGLDAELAGGQGLPVTLLPGRGLARRADLRSVGRNIGALAGLAAAVVLAVALVGRRRPAVVVAMGGYACVPVALAAWLWRRPVVLVNVDAVPGAANRLVGRFAAAAAVAFPDTPLERAVVTGAPVRPEIAAVARPGPAARAAARERLGLHPDRRVVAAVGGSLGARRINDAVVELARLWSARAEPALYHVVGRRDAAWAATVAPSAGALEYRQVDYQADMASFWQAADVVVCRAGANTVAEAAVVGVPTVLVPLPGAPDDHQTKNAAVLADAGAAVLLPDDQCTGSRLATELDALLEEPGRLTSMADAAARLGRPDAVAAVAQLVESCAAGGRRR